MSSDKYIYLKIVFSCVETSHKSKFNLQKEEVSKEVCVYVYVVPYWLWHFQEELSRNIHSITNTHFDMCLHTSGHL